MKLDPEPSSSEAEELWSRLLEQLRWTMAKDTYENLLLGSEGMELEGHRLTVEVRKAQALPWLNERMMPSILRVVHLLADPELQIAFRVEEEPGGERARDGRGEQSEGEQRARDGRGEQSEGEGRARDKLEERPTAVGKGGNGKASPTVVGCGPTVVGCGPTVVGCGPTVVGTEGNGEAKEDLGWTDFYIKLKMAFRNSALRRLKGAPLSVFLCLALHMNRSGTARPGIGAIMRETGYGRASICEALDELESLGLIAKRACREAADEYTLLGYVWFGETPAPALYETQGAGKEKERKLRN